MSMFKAALRDKRIHLYAWLAVVPRTFLTLIIVSYFGDSGVNSFAEAVSRVFENKVVVVFLLLLGGLSGYVEGWCLQRFSKKGNGSKKVLPFG